MLQRKVFFQKAIDFILLDGMGLIHRKPSFP